MGDFKKVSKDDFYEYIEKYQKENSVKLERDVAMMCEPPLITYNDFSNGKVWPESIVVKSIAEGYLGNPQEYFIPK